MTEWKTFFHGSRVVPPHNQSVRLAEELPSEGFQIALKHLQGGSIGQRPLEGLQGARFQLRVSLFDVSHRHFFGRTWKSLLQQQQQQQQQQPRTGSGQASRVPFNEVLYFHTPLRHPGVVAVVELVSVAQTPDGSQSALGCGFGILRLFSSSSSPGEPDAGQGERRLSLYHGSPRALLYQTLQEPFEQSKLLTLMEGTHLQYSLRPHPALESVMHLLPPYTLVSGAETVPGIEPPSGDAADCLRKPRLLKRSTCYLDKLSLTLYPSLEKFEEELLHQLNADHLSRKSWPPDGNSVVIQERRLHVGVHSGWGFLERPQVVVLEPETEGARGQRSSFRQGSPSRLSSSSPQVLALRSRLELKEMADHPAFGIVFQLEYVFSAPVSVNAKVTLGSSFPRTAFMQSLRWAVWCPFQGPRTGAVDVSLPLQGGDVPGPTGVMVYTAPPPDRNSTEVKDLERGTVKFQFSTRAEGLPPSPTRSLRGRQEESSRHRKPPSPSRGAPETVARASPPPSPQGPALSISQLAASPRYPTISHSASSPWQQQFPSQLHPSPLVSAYQLSHIELPRASSIAHLEVGLEGGGSEPPPAEQLQALPFAPVHAPVTTLGTQTPGATSSLSRSSMAHLFSAGFPEILDLSGQVAEVLDPSEPVNFNPQREEADPLQCNELVLQFLAFSRIPQEGVNEDWPDSVYFTFQLYRFPPVTTHRMTLLSTGKPEKKSREKRPCVLALLNKDGTVESGCPGLQLKYLVDPGSLKPGEQRWFLRYLALHTLQIDVWDSHSLLLVGSAAVELKHLLRQGRPAVQIAQELEVITTEYLQDATLVCGDLPGRSPAPVSAFTAVKGRLHMRLGNIGHPADVSVKRPAALPPARSRVVQPHDGAGGFGGGSIDDKSVSSLNARNASRARRLAETDGELASLLQGRAREACAAAGRAQRESEETRRRKQERMAAVRQREDQGPGAAPAKPSLTPRREERLQHLRDLQLIEAYRERSKAESIARMLAQTITTQHTLYATLGTAEFFEFVLKNPFNVQQTVTIESDDPELSVIVNYGEWRHFKSLTKTLTPLEEDMFHLRENGLAPQVYLRPKESVYIPLKYQTFTSEPAAVAQGPANMSSGRNANMAQKHQSNTVQAKTIKVTFRAEDGKPLAICQVGVEPTPHVIDQTFRFYHPELTFLKKAIRLPPWGALPGGPAGASDVPPHIHVRCSDPNVICDTRSMAPGEPQDVFLKVAGGPSPQIKKFFVMVFTDEWLAEPAQVWQVYVHFLQRVDLSCVTGQLTWQSLVLRGSQALRKVKCHTSHPGEIQIDPPGVFALPPNAVQDLQVGVRPRKACSKFAYLNVVDVEYHQLLASWLLCVACRQPLISKAFEISLPVGGGRGSNKKISYTNPYPGSRVFLLSSDHPDLLQFKENSFQIEGGETYTISLRFAPSQCAGTQEILVYINNHEDKNEETFCIKVQYQ